MAYNRVITWGNKISIGLRKAYRNGTRSWKDLPQCKARGGFVFCKRKVCGKRFYVHRYRLATALYCSYRCSGLARVGQKIKQASESRKRKISIANTKRWTLKLRKERSRQRKKFLASLTTVEYNKWIDNVMASKRKVIKWYGENFRSWWEVKFATWLKKNKIAYKYEPFRFMLGVRKSYTPDFYLPVAGLFVEVKGDVNDQVFLRKLKIFTKKFSSLDFCILNKDSLRKLGVL